MALFRRNDSTPTAVHARVHDGRHLWLAVRDGGSDLSLQGPDGAEVPVPTDPEDDLRTACVALPDVDPGATGLRLVAGRGRRAVGVRLDDLRPPGPTLATPVTPDGRWRWEVAAGEAGEVVVRRHPVAPHVSVRGFSVVDGRVRIALDTAGTTGATTATAVLHQDGTDLVEVPVHEGVLEVPTDVRPGPGAATWRVDGLPVVRSGQLLARAHPAVVLPPLITAEGAPAGLELRWLPDGRLALQTTTPAQAR